MSNYFSRYLKAAGINVPYEDMTKAQIEEKNKANPLSSYGFMSAQEKQNRQLSQQLYEREMQRQQDMFQQQLLAQMSSPGKIGYSMGGALGGIVDKIRGRNQPMAPQPDMRDDAELRRYQELAQEVGPEQALIILGSEIQNPQMQADGIKMMMDRQKAELEMQDLQGKITERANKPNETIEVPGMQNGLPTKTRKEIVGKKNGENVYKDLGTGINGLLQDTNEGFRTNSAGLNQRTLAFEKLMASTADALDSYDRLEKLVSKNPTALGWSGGWTALAENAINGIQNLTKTVVSENWLSDESSKDIESYKWNSIEKVAGANERIKSIVLGLAYQQAAATGDSSRSLSDKDIQFQINKIGGQITNPKNLLDLMNQNKQMLVSQLRNQSRYIKINGKPIGTGYEEDIAGLVSRVGLSEEDSSQAGGEYDGSTPLPANADEAMQRKRLEYLKNKHNKSMQ